MSVLGGSSRIPGSSLKQNQNVSDLSAISVNLLNKESITNEIGKDITAGIENDNSIPGQNVGIGKRALIMI